MAATGKSFAARFARWHVLIDNLERTEDLAHLAADHQLLEERLAQVRALQTTVEDLRSQFRAGTARMRKLAGEGDVVRTRLSENLRGRYGPTSETLIRYGIKPKRIPRRRSKKEPLEQATATEAIEAGSAA